jgi:glycosyltransferase involved in cell wall biosynthesis
MTADAVGGVWQYATTLAAALQEGGADVLIALMGPKPTQDQRDELSRRGLRVVEGSYRLEWMEEPWDDVRAAGEWLLGLERAFGPDVVHLNGYCHAALPWQRPVVVVAHSCVRSWWRAVHGEAAPPSWERYSREVARGLRAAWQVVAPTEAMLRALRDEYGGVQGGRVIPNAHVAVEPPPATKADMIFAAGRVWDQAKNIRALCDVAPSLPWPVYVAGDRVSPADGREEPAGGVRWLGRVPGQVIREWYGRTAIYALPARYEPFGLSVLEAASAGCALVLGDIASLRENWDGAAVFVAPDDRSGLAARLTELIEDPARRQALAARAVRRASQFTLARMTSAYAELYASAPGTGAFANAPGC